jgi:NADP-dependent 3-hydroxy acid dehydrogenase YdfG
VVLAARRTAECEAVAERVHAAGGQAWVTALAVTDEASVQRSVEATVAHFGCLDGAFNNAGALGVAGPLHTLNAADVQAVLQAREPERLLSIPALHAKTPFGHGQRTLSV